MPRIRFLMDDGTSLDQEVNDDVFAIAQRDQNYARVLRDKVQEAHYLGRRVDSTPIKVKKPSLDDVMVSHTNMPSDDEIARRNKLGAGGIAVGAGPFNKAEISYFQGLAKDSPYEFAEFFIPRVKEKIAPSEQVDARHLVKVGEDGKVRFLNLKTQDNPAGDNRWTEFEGVGFDPFNAAELVMDVVGGISGATLARKVGAKALKAAGLTAGGSAAGAFDVELARQGLGKLHGITDPEPMEMLEAAGARGGLAGGGSLVGSGLGQIAHNIASTPNPYFFNPSTAENFETAIHKGRKVQSDITRMPGGEKFNPDLAQLSGEPSLLTLRATLASRAGSTAEMQTSSRLLTQDESNNRILSNLIDDLVRTERPISAVEAGDAVKGLNLAEISKMPASAKKNELLRLYNENLRAQRPLRSVADVAEAGRASIIRRLRGSPETQVGEKAVNPATGLQKTLSTYQKAEEGAWREYETLVKNFEAQNTGGTPLTINISSVMDQLKEFSTHADYLWKDKSKQRFTSVLKPLEDVVEMADGRVTLPELNANLSAMKEDLRIAQKEVSFESPSIAAQQAAINALQTVRDNWLTSVIKAPHIAAALETAEATTKRVHDLTKRSVAKKFLLKDGTGSYKIKNPDTVFEDIMVPGNDEGMRQWIDIVDNDPAMMQATKDWYGQHYHNSVIRNGLADPLLHKQWMRNYGSQAELVFGKDFPVLQRLGGIGFAVKAGEQKLAKLERIMRTSSNGKIDRMDPEKIVDSLLGVHAREGGAALRQGGLNVHETRNFVEVMRKESPETLALVRDRAKEMIRKSMFGDELTASNAKGINSTTLGKFLEETQEQKLSAVMGAQFVADIKALQRGLEVMERSGKAIAMPMETTALSAFRVIFGPLSKIQRTITAARKYSVLGQERKLADIISDPEKLRQVMRVANMPAESPTAMAVLTSLGLVAATQ